MYAECQPNSNVIMLLNHKASQDKRPLTLLALHVLWNRLIFRLYSVHVRNSVHVRSVKKDTLVFALGSFNNYFILFNTLEIVCMLEIV